MNSRTIFLTISIVLISQKCLAKPLSGIAVDGSLKSESSRLRRNNNLKKPTFTITGGAKRGSALFHSFRKFNVPKNHSVYFRTQPGVKRIFSRVFSGKSKINGTLGVEGKSDLFIMNPNGFIFNESARLDFNGSFSILTAESMQFRNFEYKTVGPIEIPKSNIGTIPSAINFTSQNGSITIKNKGVSLIQPDSSLLSPVIVGDVFSGITNISEGNLSIIGNKVNLDGAIINLTSGNLTLASINKGIVNLKKNKNAAYEYIFSNSIKNNLNITNNSFILKTNFSTGNIDLIGNNISLLDSTISNISAGLTNDGTISVRADNNFKINGSGGSSLPVGFKRRISGILSSNSGFGAGSDINIKAKKSNVDNSGLILTSTFSDGKAGDILVDSNFFGIDNSSIELQSLTDNGSSVSSAAQGGRGDTGNITVLARQLSIKNGSTLSTSTLGTGNAGDIRVYSDFTSVEGFNSKSAFPSSLISTSAFNGDTGNISIFSNQLSIKNGAGLGTSTFGSGKARSIKIDSDRVLVSGSRPDTVNSNSSIFAIGSNIGKERAFIIFEGVPIDLTGDSGDINIQTKSLSLLDGGQVTAANSGPGLGGLVSINAEKDIKLSFAQITSNTNGGDGGSVNLVSELLLLNKGLISSSTKKDGLGGNVTISADIIAAQNSSVISADAQNSQAGNINIIAGNFILNDAEISASSNLGASSNGEISITQKGNELRLTDNLPTVDNSVAAVTSQCTNTGKISNQGSGVNYLALSETQRKALDLKQRLAITNQYTYIDHKTGERKPFKRWHGIQKNADGNLEFIFSPEQSKTLQNMLSSVENICLKS